MSVSWLIKLLYVLGLIIWVVAALLLGQALAALAIAQLPVANPSVLMTVYASLGYLLGIALVFGIPFLITRRFVDRETIGFSRLLSWGDIGLGTLAVLPYYILSGVLLYLGMEVLTVIDPTVGQEIGFKQLTTNIEYMVAFLTLVVVAPFAEEVLFRGYFFGHLSKRTNAIIALFVSSIVFGALHLVGFKDDGIVLQWGAAVDTFAMGMVAGMLRITTGSIWAGILLHAIKNGIAYYFLFIAPLSGGGM